MSAVKTLADDGYAKALETATAIARDALSGTGQWVYVSGYGFVYVPRKALSNA